MAPSTPLNDENQVIVVAAPGRIEHYSIVYFDAFEAP